MSQANRTDVTVLVPAAGRVPEGVIALANIACPAMIPVGGRPVIHWTLSYLESLGCSTFKIAVARRGTFIEDFIACTARGLDVEILVPSRDTGVLRTVLDLLETVRTKSALIVLGDTHFQFDGATDAGLPDSDVPVVLTSMVDDSYRWCVAD